MLRRIFGRKTEEEAGGWIALHKQELRMLFSLAHIIRVNRRGRMTWAGRVARVGTNEKCVPNCSRNT
jgi:hypothetical protein